MSTLEDVRHLTWRGRLSWAYYRLRRLCVVPAAPEDRCVMGYPIGDHVLCPRRAVDGRMWCRKHIRQEQR